VRNGGIRGPPAPLLPIPRLSPTAGAPQRARLFFGFHASLLPRQFNFPLVKLDLLAMHRSLEIELLPLKIQLLPLKIQFAALHFCVRGRDEVLRDWLDDGLRNIADELPANLLALKPFAPPAPQEAKKSVEQPWNKALSRGPYNG
jgi:hypothetical protein